MLSFSNTVEIFKRKKSFRVLTAYVVWIPGATGDTTGRPRACNCFLSITTHSLGKREPKGLRAAARTYGCEAGLWVRAGPGPQQCLLSVRSITLHTHPKQPW